MTIVYVGFSMVFNDASYILLSQFDFGGEKLLKNALYKNIIRIKIVANYNIQLLYIFLISCTILKSLYFFSCCTI